jgi:hypothetical protein
MRAISALLLTIILQAPLCAAVFQRDLHSPGDGLITYDDVSNREWLDLTETATVDLSVVREALEPGGTLAGFHFATAQDVVPLAISAGVKPSPEQELYSTAAGTQAKKLNALVGKIVQSESEILGVGSIALGLVALRIDGNVPLFDDTNFLVVSLNEDAREDSSPLFVKPSGAYLFSTPLIYPGFPALGRGSSGPFWLYRQAVPEPHVTGLWLAILGLVSRTRRHSQ